MSMNDEEILSTKDALLDHLYAVINEFNPTHASKITGMFAELSEAQLMVLLGDQQLLKKKSAEAVESILRLSYSEDGDSQDQSMEDRLYEEVHGIEPLNSSRITGMLLELDHSAQQHLLEDPESLRLAITRAANEIHESDRSRIPDDLGDALYEAVCKLYPKNAPKITGMLTELGEDKLRSLLVDANKDLVNMVDSCRLTLQDTGQWIHE